MRLLSACVSAGMTEIEGEITRASVGGCVCVWCEPEKECECKRPFHMKETPCRDKTGGVHGSIIYRLKGFKGGLQGLNENRCLCC